jgi:hypothetical protein
MDQDDGDVQVACERPQLGDHHRHVVGLVLADPGCEPAQRIEHDQAGSDVFDQRSQPAEVPWQA